MSHCFGPASCPNGKWLCLREGVDDRVMSPRFKTENTIAIREVTDDRFCVPETHYALSGDVNIAYQTMGNGPVDIVVVPGIMSHVEFLHELPGYTAFMRRLSTFARVVMFDKRGQGCPTG